MKIGSSVFDSKRKCYIMGILNMTPDSFSDGGKWSTRDLALKRAGEMIREGVDVIDVGGESTRPGYVEVSVEEELDRALPIIEAIVSHFKTPVSIDTYKSRVAAPALAAGAVLVNDIWGLKKDPDIARVVSESGASCCIMHNRVNIDYSDFMSDMLADLGESVGIAVGAGIPPDKIMLDPGIGFAKTHAMNLEAINKLDMLKSLGYPIMLGASRKSVIGLALNLPVEERLEGSLAAAVIGAMRGASFVRVHDVKQTRMALTMAERIIYG
ncbi:MAG: dihydropteroate synthase [Oscillospiraceae bacterium]|nr:dihydropteroate synthase [Oscillospiraceae bacterium]